MLEVCVLRIILFTAYTLWSKFIESISTSWIDLIGLFLCVNCKYCFSHARNLNPYLHFPWIKQNAQQSRPTTDHNCVRSEKCPIYACILSNYSSSSIQYKQHGIKFRSTNKSTPIPNAPHTPLLTHRSPYRMRKLINSFRSFSRRIMPFPLTSHRPSRAIFGAVWVMCYCLCVYFGLMCEWLGVPIQREWLPKSCWRCSRLHFVHIAKVVPGC